MAFSAISDMTDVRVNEAVRMFRKMERTCTVASEAADKGLEPGEYVAELQWRAVDDHRPMRLMKLSADGESLEDTEGLGDDMPWGLLLAMTDGHPEDMVVTPEFTLRVLKTSEDRRQAMIRAIRQLSAMSTVEQLVERGSLPRGQRFEMTTGRGRRTIVTVDPDNGSLRVQRGFPVPCTLAVMLAFHTGVCRLYAGGDFTVSVPGLAAAMDVDLDAVRAPSSAPRAPRLRGDDPPVMYTLTRMRS